MQQCHPAMLLCYHALKMDTFFQLSSLKKTRKKDVCMITSCYLTINDYLH